MVPINLICPHCLQHFFFEHLFHLYDDVCVFQEESRASKASVPRLDTPTCELPANWGIYPLVWKQLWLNNKIFYVY